jgi:hypothetical protein
MRAIIRFLYHALPIISQSRMVLHRDARVHLHRVLCRQPLLTNIVAASPR